MSTATIAAPPSPLVGVPIRLNEGDVIPPGIVDHESFRRWARSPAFPRRGRIAFLNGSIWVDQTMEQAYTHNLVKLQMGRMAAPVVEGADSGHFFTDGMLLSNVRVGLSTIPDGIFVSFEALETGRVREISGAENGCIEFEGSPDMVLEIVSRFSEDKDKELLTLYYRAGIPEYWIVDVRQDKVLFDIFGRGARKYVATKRQAGGWLQSAVFDRSFRLTQTVDRRDKPMFLLEVK